MVHTSVCTTVHAPSSLGPQSDIRACRWLQTSTHFLANLLRRKLAMHHFILEFPPNHDAEVTSCMTSFAWLVQHFRRLQFFGLVGRPETESRCYRSSYLIL